MSGCGSRSPMREWRSDIDVARGRGNESVGGRPRPEKVVTKTFMFLDSMMVAVIVSDLMASPCLLPWLAIS